MAGRAPESCLTESAACCASFLCEPFLVKPAFQPDDHFSIFRLARSVLVSETAWSASVRMVARSVLGEGAGVGCADRAARLMLSANTKIAARAFFMKILLWW